MLRFRWITFDRFKVVNLSRFYRVNFIRPYWVNFTVFSTKVTLSADEKTRVSVHLGKDAFSHYDVASGEFRVSPGVFEVIVGANAREESLKTSLTIE